MDRLSGFAVMVRYVFLEARRALLIGLLFPFLIMGLSTLPAVLAGRDAGKTRIALVAAEGAEPKFEAFVTALKADPRLSVQPMTEAAGREGLRAGGIDNVIIVPARAGERVKVVFGADLSGVSRQRLIPMAMAATGLSLDPDLDPQFERLGGLQSSPFLGFLPLVLTVFILNQGLTATVNAVVSAKEKGILRHMALLPVPVTDFLAANVLVRGASAMVQVGIILSLLPASGALKDGAAILAIAGFAFLFVGATLSIGVLIAGRMSTVAVSTQVTVPLVLACLYLGGGMPGADRLPLVEMLAPALPVRYFTDAVRQLALGQSGRFPLPLDAVALLAFSLVALALAARTFRLESRS